MTLSSHRHCEPQPSLVVQRNRFFPSNHAILIACFGVALVFAGMGFAAEVRPEQALTAVGNWLRSTQQRPLATALTRSSDSVQSIRDAQGRALCHVVALQGGGFVVTGGDDGVVPIVAFAAKGAFPLDLRHPLRAILHRDLPERLAWADQRRAKPATRQDVRAPDYAAQWQLLLAPYQDTRSGIEFLDDLRVPPLVQSTWGQDFIYSDSWEKINVYNYYTPNNYVTGCVATVGAQLMRFHEYPTTAVKKQTKDCEVDGTVRPLPLFGGIYAWQDMPLRPDATITVAQREAIGKLLNDVAVSVNMSFTARSSSASVYDFSKRLRDTFHFANAKYFLCWDDGLSISSTTHYEDMLLSNLDAGYPTVLGLTGDQGGHAVVGDGYGFHSGRLYVHLNMGWDGSEDSWYNLPTIETDQFTFTVFDELLFNAFPEFSGELISGRVTDLAEQPLAGVAVTAQNATTRAIVAETTTNERGIYALKIPAPTPAQKRYRVRAAFRGAEETEMVDNIITSNDYNIIDTADNDIRVAIGSRWGVDIQLDPLPFTYTVKDAVVTITGYDGEPTAMVVPDVIEDLPVVAIAAGAFQNFASLTSAVLPDSVVFVGAAAFAGCLNLQSVTFGRGVASLGYGALQDCPALAGIVVSPENSAFATDAVGALFSHDFSALYRYPPARAGSYEVPAGVSSFYPYAFDGCSDLQELILPDSLRDIDTAAFRYCAPLTTLNLPAGLSYIGDDAFVDSSITEFVFLGAPPELGGAPFPAGATLRYYQTNPAWDGMDAFGGCPVVMIPVFHAVSFVLGDKGRTDDAPLLSQQVQHRTAAVAPAVVTDSPWAFAGWDADFSAVVGDMTIHARYSYRREVALVAGWQIIGLDFVPDETCGAALAAENITRYDAAGKAFVRPVGFVSGRAYWLFREVPGAITLSGDIVAAPPLPSTRGWHFVVIGANYAALPADVAVAWQWRHGRYARVTALARGEGYWLYCLGAER